MKRILIKRILTIGAILLIPAVAAAQGTRGPAKPATPAPPSATMDKAALEAELLASEQKIDEAVAKGSVAAFKALVSDTGWSVDQNGPMSVADFQKSLAKVKIDAGWAITDSKVVWIDTNSAVVSYKWTGKGTMSGQPLPSPVYASTVWTKRGGKWVAVFHQETTAAAK